MTIYASNFPILRPAKPKKPVPGWGSEHAAAAVERLKVALPGAVAEVCRDWEQVAAVVDRAKVHEALRFLRDDPECGFDLLLDVTCIDTLNYPGDLKGNARYADQVPACPERFAVHYVLNATAKKSWLRVKAWLPEGDPSVPTASDLWPAANWAEREAGEMYGVVFQGHPDPRKLLLPEGYQGYPLRKDYPLRGRGERENFPRYNPEEDI